MSPRTPRANEVPGNPETSDEREPALPEATLPARGSNPRRQAPLTPGHLEPDRGPILKTQHPLALLRAAVTARSLPPPLLLASGRCCCICTLPPFLPPTRGSGPGFTCTTLVAEAILLPIVTPDQGQLPGRRRAAQVSGVGSAGRSLCDVTEEL